MKNVVWLVNGVTIAIPEKIKIQGLTTHKEKNKTFVSFICEEE